MTTIRLVVADDQDLVRAGLVSLLDGAEGLQVVGQARDGKEAVEVIRAERPDVALLDIRMPVLNGIEAIQRLRDDPGLASTRAVVLTTFGLDDYVFHALRAGADGFLVKDIDPDELVRSIHSVAHGDAVISPAVTRALIDDFLTRGPSRPSNAAPDLTSRERDVLAGICRGLSNREIARDLYIGEATVKTYASRLFEKFDVVSRVGLVIAAHDHGLANTAR